MMQLNKGSKNTINTLGILSPKAKQCILSIHPSLHSSNK